MSQPYQIAFLPILKGFEGCINQMYQDARGNVTCGVGFLLETATIATAFSVNCPFYLSAAYQTTATAQEVAAEWWRVKALPAGLPVASYDAVGALQLKQEDIDAHLLGILDQTDVDLQNDYPGFENFPDAVKMALADMDYNLGDSKLRNTYPKFDAAVDRQDWPTAAQECQRGGIQPSRNEWCRQQFLSVANPTT